MVQKAILDIEAPLHIAQECLYQRENRQGNLTVLKALGINTTKYYNRN